jgi:ribosomal protein S18 acetylase RimI-like enzyme
MLIRTCCAADVELLEQRLPSGGTCAHAYHFAQQQTGGQLYLVALEHHLPAGSCVLRWNGWAGTAVGAHLRDCPEITNLHVVKELRSQGIGTALIGAAEDRARAAGFERISIGVAEENPRAAKLYERLGYDDTGLRHQSRYHYPDQDGVDREIVEHDRALVKTLR